MDIARSHIHSILSHRECICSPIEPLMKIICPPAHRIREVFLSNQLSACPWHQRRLLSNHLHVCPLHPEKTFVESFACLSIAYEKPFVESFVRLSIASEPFIEAFGCLPIASKKPCCRIIHQLGHCIGEAFLLNHSSACPLHRRSLFVESSVDMAIASDKPFVESFIRLSVASETSFLKPCKSFVACPSHHREPFCRIIRPPACCIR